KLPCSPVSAAMELAAQDETCAEARSDGQEEEVVDAACDAEPLLAEGREVDVVLDRHLQLEHPPCLGSERHPLEPGNARHVDDAGLRVHDSGDANDGSVDRVLGDTRAVDE